jgi:ribosome biogenesis protein Nip4
MRPSAEQQFLYGHNVMKLGLGMISESVGKCGGVVLYSMADVALGFGMAAKSTLEPSSLSVSRMLESISARKTVSLNPSTIIVNCI